MQVLFFSFPSFFSIPHFYFDMMQMLNEIDQKQQQKDKELSLLSDNKQRRFSFFSSTHKRTTTTTPFLTQLNYLLRFVLFFPMVFQKKIKLFPKIGEPSSTTSETQVFFGFDYYYLLLCLYLLALSSFKWGSMIKKQSEIDLFLYIFQFVSCVL